MQAPLDAELVLAEDDPDDRFLIVHALRRLRPQLQVATVADGIELIAHLQQRGDGALPRLVLLDLNMPRMDGREVLARLRDDQVFRSIPVVVLSTSVEPEDRSRTHALQAAAFLSKPEEFGAMLAALRELLDQRLGPLPVAETEA